MHGCFDFRLHPIGFQFFSRCYVRFPPLVRARAHGMAAPEAETGTPGALPHQLLGEFVKPVAVRGASHSPSKTPTNKSESKGRRRLADRDAPRRKRSSVSMMSNLTIEALQFLLQQPRNRLLIEESHELQAGTQMGKYMEQKGQENRLFQKDASRPAAGFFTTLQLRSACCL